MKRSLFIIAAIIGLVTYVVSTSAIPLNESVIRYSFLPDSSGGDTSDSGGIIYPGPGH